MSYILDALKKSERERALENITSLSPVPQAQLHSEQHLLRWLIGFVVLGIALLLIWQFHTPLLKMAHTYLRDAKVSKTELKSPDSVSVMKQIEEAPAPNPTQQVEEISLQVEGQEITKLVNIDSKSELPQVVTSNDNNIESTRQTTTLPGGEVAIKPAAKSKILSLNLAPAAVRQKLSALTLSVVSYTKNEERRFVLVNDQLFREGDGLPGGAVVEEITHDGMVVAFQGVKVLLRP